MTDKAKDAAYEAMGVFWSEARSALFPRGCVPEITRTLIEWRLAAEHVSAAAEAAENYFRFKAPKK